MTQKEFSRIRTQLGKTQKEMAQLLGSSLKAVQSFEQGWRNIPVHIERQLLFLVALKHSGKRDRERKCWAMKDCPKETREKCPAWEFHSGDLCWLINGTICHGEPQKTWQKKMAMCRKCEVFRSKVATL